MLLLSVPTHSDRVIGHYDVVQVKYEMLRRVRLDARRVSDAAADFGFSRPSF